MSAPKNTKGKAAAAATNYLRHVHQSKGIGGWRSLYLDLLTAPQLSNHDSIIEFGAGSPDFLASTSAARRVAVDISDKYKDSFEAAGVEFAVHNLEVDDLSSLGQFDVAICSDVFEHLLNPDSALRSLESALRPEGILFSHVPNEYRLGTTLRIMLGLQEGLYFHLKESEWTDPHIRRFTDLGFRRFLQQYFQWNVKITHLRYRGIARVLRNATIKVPLCLEGGPTYISTNSRKRYEDIITAISLRQR